MICMSYLLTSNCTGNVVRRCARDTLGMNVNGRYTGDDLKEGSFDELGTGSLESRPQLGDFTLPGGSKNR